MQEFWKLVISFGLGFLASAVLFAENTTGSLNWLAIAGVAVILGLVIRIFPKIGMELLEGLS